MGREMNKAQYMGILEQQLARLPISERNELLYEYEAHFTFGLQNGKSEAEISYELGNPYEIVKEVLQDRNDLHAASFEHVTSYPRAAHVQSSTSGVRTILLSIGLGFLTLAIVFPIGVSLWAAWFAFSVSSIAFFLSPIAALLDYILYNEFVPAKWYTAIGLVGVGLIFTTTIKPVYSWLLQATVGYWNWMRSLVKESNYE